MSQQYEVTQGPLTLVPGIVVYLSEEQAHLRQPALKKHKNGAYEVLAPVQFKNGEVLGFDEVPTKAILSAFFSVDKIQALQAEKVIKTSKKTASNKGGA